MCSFKWVAPLLTCRYMFGVSFMCFNLLFLFSFIWTGLCRHKAPTKLTENPLAAGEPTQQASSENGCELPASTNQHSFQRNASQHEGMFLAFR